MVSLVNLSRIIAKVGLLNYLSYNTKNKQVHNNLVIENLINMKILGLIPARGGSKGIPRKNIKLLDGKPLICYSIEDALACPLIDQVVVSTEDEEIAEISKSAGAAVPFLRPAALATDGSPTIDMVIHALQYFNSNEVNFDAVCLLQPTVPFRNKLDLSSAINKFIESNTDSLISVRKVPHIYNPRWIYERNKEHGYLERAINDKKRITRRQDLPEAYHRDGSIYLTKSTIVLDEHSLYGNKIMHHIMSNSPNINIDTMEDWALAESFISASINE